MELIVWVLAIALLIGIGSHETQEEKDYEAKLRAVATEEEERG